MSPILLQPNPQHSPEADMWVAVLQQAVKDAKRKPPRDNSETVRALQQEAMRFFRSAHYYNITMALGIEHKAARQVAQEVLRV